MARNWLTPFLSACVRGFRDDEARSRLDRFRADHPQLRPDELVRRWVEHRLRETGVVYGTPLASEETIAHHTLKGFAQRKAVFLAILQIQAEIAMEVGCTVRHCTAGNIRVAELLVCLAVASHRPRLAAKIHEIISTLSEDGPPPPRLLRYANRVGKAVEKQAYLSGNPLLGLPIHNSLNYINAKTLGRLAVTYFERGLHPSSIQKVLAFDAHEKELLLRALLGLSHADGPLRSFSSRIVNQQIKAAHLPWKVRRALLRLLKEVPTPLTVAAVVPDERTRDFLLEQVILGAILDGHLSERESAYIGDLAEWLGVNPEDLARREAELVQFYEQHRAYLDLFTVGSTMLSYRQRMIERLQVSISENLGLIVQEIRNQRGLAELLYKASRGVEISAEERRRVGRQLLDILRTIPALAIFSLPGGTFLLPLLFKVLPKGLKPRAFAERDARKEIAGDERELL